MQIVFFAILKGVNSMTAMLCFKIYYTPEYGIEIFKFKRYKMVILVKIFNNNFKEFINTLNL